MALVAPHSTLAALYQSQDSAWHPLGWPKRILQAPSLLLEHVGHRLAAAQPAMADRPPSCGRTVAQSAWHLAQSPLAKGLATPLAAVLLGGAAPLVAAASAGALALQVGTGAHSPQKAQAMASAAQNIGQALQGTLLQYGLIGCCTELLPVFFAQQGTRWRAQTQGTQLQRNVGWAMESTGYIAALLCGAILTVARVAVAAAWSTGHLLLMAIAASAGAAWGLGSHLIYEMPWTRESETPQKPAAAPTAEGAQAAALSPSAVVPAKATVASAPAARTPALAPAAP